MTVVGAVSAQPRTASASTERVRRWLPEIGLLIIVGWLVVLPLAMIAYGSFRQGPPYAASPLTIGNYARVLTSTTYQRAILNTLIVGVSSTLISVVGGTALAWMTTRVKLPGMKLIRVAVGLPFFISSFLGAIAWVYLAAPRFGLLNHLVQAIWHGAPQINIYSLSGMAWVHGLYDMPIAFLMISGTMAALDASLEESARVTGARAMKVARTIVMPLLLPSIISSALLCFIHSVESYAVPAVLGTPVGIDLLATRIAIDLQSSPPAYGPASASAILLTIVAAIGMYGYHRATRVQQRFVTVSGKATARPGAARGWGVVAGVVLAWLYVFLAVILPIGVVVIASFQAYWGQPVIGFTPTWKNYVAVLHLPNFVPAFSNSLLLALLGPTLAVLLGLAVSYFNLRKPSALSRIIDGIAIVPHAVPGLVIGLALLWTYLFLPNPIYGTVWILLLALITRFLPYASRPIHAALLQLSPELEEASRVTGASAVRTFFKVLVPLAAPALISAWLLLYVVFLREISTVVLLVSLDTNSLPILLFNLFTDGWYTQGAALAVMQLLMMGAGWIALSRFIGSAPGRQIHVA